MKKYFLHASFIAAIVIIFSSSSANANPCITCHTEETPRIVEQWKKSQHYVNGVECEVCHVAGAGDQNSEAHHGVRITTNLTVLYCEGCHALAEEEMAASRDKNGVFSHEPLK